MPGTDATAERGFTLLEVMLTVAILVALTAGAFETLAARPAQTRSTAVAFAGLIAQARSLASIDAGDVADGTGASIGVVRDGDAYVATVYRFRPVAGGPPPELAANVAPFRTRTPVLLAAGNGVVEPPFAIFIAPSGHASALAGFTFGAGAPLRAEPGCAAQTGIGLIFSDAPRAQRFEVSCEMAQLDLDAARPSP